MTWIKLSLYFAVSQFCMLALAGEVRGKVIAEGSNDQPVVVYIEKANIPSVAPKANATLAQKNEAFVPASLVVVQGQTVDFPNYDKFFHNVFSLTPGNDFDLGLYRAGGSKSVQMREPGEVEVYCNIHPGMKAKILVLQNPLYALVDKTGAYTISGVPEGQYTLVAWSASHKPQKQSIQISGKPTIMNFSLERREEPATHLDKNGQQYGRYH